MSPADWKDALESLREALPGSDAGEAAETTDAAAPSSDGHRRPMKLGVALERKGRAGKTATIVFGFTCSEEELKEIASQLKKRLGTGGSARGGEILIQGDRLEEVTRALKSLGLMK